MTNRLRKILAQSRRRTSNRVLSTLRNQHLFWMDRQIKRAIPDEEKREEYIDALIEEFIITCDNCDLRDSCSRNYESCGFNPKNE